MMIKFKHYEEILNIVTWLNDNISPGGECKFWLSETNGQKSFYSHDYNSWRLEWFELMGYAILTGISDDVTVALRLTFDFEREP